MRIWVTGADGFVGQHLISRLLARGDDVAGTTFGVEPGSGTLSAAERDAVSWSQAPLDDAEALVRHAQTVRPEAIVHLAGYSSSAETRERPREALAANVQGTLSLLSAAHEAGSVRRVLVAGSADAYGRGDDDPIAETAPFQPESVYGTTKAAQDVVARGVGSALELEVCVARLFPLLGPGQRAPFMLPSFCRRALAIVQGRHEPRIRVGNLEIERDFMDVRDGATALEGLLHAPHLAHDAYNVCSGAGTRVGALLAWVLEAAGIAPEVVSDPDLVRPDEPVRVVGDPTRLDATIEWRVERNLQTCASDTLKWQMDLHDSAPDRRDG